MSKRIITISGDTGSGKTTVINALFEYLTHQGLQVLRGRGACSYLPIRLQIEQMSPQCVLFDCDGTDPDEAAKVVKKLAHKFPDIHFYITN